MKKFTFTAVKKNGSNIYSGSFSSELWFLRAMCQYQAEGYVVIHAACIDIDDNTDALNVTTLSKYCSEL